VWRAHGDVARKELSESTRAAAPLPFGSFDESVFALAETPYGFGAG